RQASVRRTSVSAWASVAPAITQAGQAARALTTSPPRVAPIQPIRRSAEKAGPTAETALRARPGVRGIPFQDSGSAPVLPGYRKRTSLGRTGDEPQACFVNAFTSCTRDRNIRGVPP